MRRNFGVTVQQGAVETGAVAFGRARKVRDRLIEVWKFGVKLKVELNEV
jgi:hypothetical protein